MATWEWPPEKPGGKPRRAEGQTEEEAWQNYLFATRGQNEPQEDWDKRTELGHFRDIANGIGQGLLDPIEGLAQMVEHATGKKLAPEGLRKWARDYRKDVQSTWAGRGGELVGNVAGFALPGGAIARGVSGIGKAVGLAPTLADIAGSTIAGGTLGESVPVQGATSENEYWKTKKDQAVIGALTGGTLPSIARGMRSTVPPGHYMSIHHPWLSIAPRVTRALGTGLARVAPESAGAAAATATEEADRE
jgi:hypothetical protein